MNGARQRLGAITLFAFTSFVTAHASAQPSPDCTVNRKCSSTGIDCHEDDRNCIERARENSLEVLCEDTEKRRLVYCPPDTGRAESRVVWLLLGVAGALALSGSLTAYFIFRKKA